MSRLTIVDRTKLNLSEVTILLTGANVLEMDVLMQMFAGFGARQLRRAENLAQTMEAIEAELIDLVMIDGAAGLADAVQVVRDLRRMSGASRYAPVVLTTANVMPSVLNEARDAGVNYLITKPLAPRIVFERLVWIVRDARPFIEADTYVGPDRRIRSLGPPAGIAGRRVGDLSADVGEAETPNMSQADIDALMSPVRKSL